jgi:transposase
MGLHIGPSQGERSVSPTVREFFQQFPDEETCLNHLFETRFGQGHECPSCKRSAKWYRIKKEPAYSCQWCGHHLHPMAGTIFEDSRTSLQDWFYAMYLFTTSRHGVPAKELQRQIGVTYKTAWRMGHKIREHMAAADGEEPLSGVVEVDETYVGGHRPGRPGRGALGKTIVMGIVERDGDVVTKVVPDFAKSTLVPVIEANVEKGSTVYSDELPSYGGLEDKGYEHETVHHRSREYVRGEVHTNTIEGYFSRLKNSIRGTHVHVSPKHLQKYVGEFEFRYNRRKQPRRMMTELLSTFPRHDEE